MNRKKTTSKFIRESIKVNGHKCDYSLVEYKGAHEKVKIKSKYGIFEMTPDKHLQGRIGNIRSALNKTKWIINQFREVHGDEYDYSLVKYEKSSTKVSIISEYGVFKQTPHKHLQGRGCPKKALIKAIDRGTWSYSSWEKSAKKSKNFDSFKVYIIRCWNEDEEFYKIGRTFNTVENRFKTSFLMPYNYEVISLIKGSAKIICKEERTLQNKNSRYRFTPSIEFSGMTECFSKIDQYGNKSKNK